MQENKEDHTHYCPICKSTVLCDCLTKSGNTGGYCNDGKESYCTPCQTNRWDEVVEDLRNDGRID